MTFEDDKAADKASKVFDNVAVDSIINRVKPYYDNKGESPRKSTSLLKKRLYLMNLPYDATIREIEGLVKEFVEIEEVVVPRDK